MNKVFFPPHGPVRRQVAKDERVGEILTQCGRVTEGYGGWCKGKQQRHSFMHAYSKHLLGTSEASDPANIILRKTIPTLKNIQKKKYIYIYIYIYIYTHSMLGRNLPSRLST